MSTYRDGPGPTCDACRQHVPDGRLSLTAEGQQLCPTCFGSYQSAKADQRARTNEVFRRCLCGAVLSPYGDVTIRPYRDGEANLSYYFQPSLYCCSECGRRFRIAHPVVAVLIVGSFAVLAFSSWMQGGDSRVWTPVFLVLTAGALALEMTKRRRYPRVR